MTQSYFPFDNGSGANVQESQWTKMAQNWLETGVISNYFNQLEVYADSTGMQAKVKSGAAWIKGHYFESDEEEILPINTADAVNPRIDRIILRLDWTNNRIELAVLQGVPAVSPIPPGRSQNSSRWEISLARVNVGAGVTTITASDIKEERNFAPSSLFTATSSTKGDLYPDGTSVISVNDTTDSGWPHPYGTVVTYKSSNVRCHQVFYGSYQNSSQEVFHRDYYEGAVGWSPWLKITSNPVRVSAYRTMDLTLSPNVYTKVTTFNEEWQDTRSTMNISTGTFVAPEKGIYSVLVYAAIYIESGASGYITVYRNGALYRHLAVADSIGSMYQEVVGFEEITMNKGDTLELYLRQSGTTDRIAKGIRMVIRGD